MLCLAALLIQIMPMPTTEGFVSGDKAYLLMPPIPVCGQVVRSFGWSTDGKRAAVLAVEMPDRAVESLANGEPPGDAKWSLVIWKADQLRGTSVLSGSATDRTSLEWSEAQWIGSGLYLLDEARDGSDGARLIHVSSGGQATTLGLPAVPKGGYIFAQSPPLDLGALVQYEKVEAGYALTIRFLRPEGPVGSPHRVTATRLTFEMHGKTNRLAFLTGTEPRDASSWKAIGPDGVTSPVTDTMRPQTETARTGFRLEDQPLRIAGGEGGAKISALWIKSDSDAEKSAALVSADATYGDAEVAPTRDAVLYVSRGVALVRRIVTMDKALFLQIREAAMRTEAIATAKQCAMAVIMYAADNDDVAPPASDREKLLPYIRDREMLGRFVYKFQGGSLDDLKSPSEVEIGHVEGPGGRAIAYADGHVQWRKD